MLVADTTFFIALFRKDDGMHERALVLERAMDKRGDMMLLTTHVVDETAAYVFRRDGSENAYEVAKTLLTAKNVSIESVDRMELANAAEIMRKYKRLNLCDSLSVELTGKYGIKEILSFDEDFDHVEKIKRLH